MKRNESVLFVITFFLATVAAIVAFCYADRVRGYNATGSEVFILTLPVLCVTSRIELLTRRVERLKKKLDKIKSV